MQSAQWKGHNLANAMVQACYRLGLTHAVVLMGIDGFNGQRTQPQSSFPLKNHVPPIVEILDAADKIDNALPTLENMVGDAPIAVTEVELFQYDAG